MTVALFGITNDALNLAVNLLILFLVVLWIALVAWTFLDARRRIKDPVLVACATAASLFPFVGSIVYSILRPPEFLEDRRERGLEIRASELRVRQLEEASCPNCEHPVERTYLRCPNCKSRIKDPCESCGKPVDPRWSICPYCETPTRHSAPAERERRPSAGKRRAKAPAKPSSRQGSSGSARQSSSSPEAPPRSSRSTDGESKKRSAPAPTARTSRPSRSQETRPPSPSRPPKPSAE